jgi:hypothetical protein
MKPFLFLFIMTTASLISFSQTTAWKEMQDFHAVMSKTFHPAEENNLQPTKDSAAVLLTKAKAWQNSAVPKGYNATVAAPILKQLVAECDAINKAVADKKTDTELKQLITKAHETFHELTEKCRPGEEEKH